MNVQVSETTYNSESDQVQNTGLSNKIHSSPTINDHNFSMQVQVPEVVEQLEGFLRNIRRYEVCTGNFDQKFQDILPLYSVMTKSKSREISHAFQECDIVASHGDIRYRSTIRSIHCKPLYLKSINQRTSRCKACCIYRCSLINILSRRERTKKP